MKGLARSLCPPLVWDGLRRLRATATARRAAADASRQDLDLYWDAEFARVLDTWGEGNVWNEIQLLLADARGRALDIACGTGRTMEILRGFVELEIHGCDISDLLISRARERGIDPTRLTVCDATAMPYGDGSFDWSYSIGSLEHFTLDGIDRLIDEARRVTRRATYHFMPTSRSGRDEGWMKTTQSFHNNSVEWWRARFARRFPEVRVVGSSWNDHISVGHWFLCWSEARGPREGAT